MRSSRKLARLAGQEATYVYLAGGGQPNYRTLARFRRANAAAFVTVFQETVILAFRVGLVRLGHVALDGTKLKANSSKHKAMSYGRMKQREAQLCEEIAQLVAQANAQDAAEDSEYGSDSDGYSVAEELTRRANRLAKIQALRERLEAEKRTEQRTPATEQPEIAEKEQRSFADGDARMMLMKRGEYGYGYNAQAAVDEMSGVIVAATLTNVSSDTGHLPALVAQIRELRAVTDTSDPTIVSADAGYFSGANIAEDGAGIDLLIAAGQDDPAATGQTEGLYAVDAFAYDGERDVWICPADHLLHPQVTSPGTRGQRRTDRYLASPTDCADCRLRTHCLKPGQTQRVIVAQRSRPTGAMRFKLRQPQARLLYARRKVIVEPVFGQLKENRAFTALSLRGLTLAVGEFLLACLAHNLGKLLRVCPLLTPLLPVLNCPTGRSRLSPAPTQRIPDGLQRFSFLSSDRRLCAVHP